MLKLAFLEMEDRAGQSLRQFLEQRLADCCAIVELPEAEALMLNGDSPQSEGILRTEQARSVIRPILLTTYSPARFAEHDVVVLAKPVTAGMLREQVLALQEKLHPPPVPLAAEDFGEAALAVADTLPSANDVASIVAEGDARQSETGAVESLARRGTAAGQLAATERHFYLGSMPDVDLNDPASLAGISYDPASFLIGHVSRALSMGIDQASVVRLSNAAFQQIVIYPFARRASCSASGSTLFGAGRLPIPMQAVQTEVLREWPQFPPETLETEQIDSLIWRLGLWASRGRIPQGTSLDSPVRLRLWPNLTRLLIPPHAVRILGLWSRHPVSLRETVRVLGVPQRYVFGVYSACMAIGVIDLPELGQAAAPLAEAKPLVAHQKRGLFRMILSRLMTSGNEGGV